MLEGCNSGQGTTQSSTHNGNAALATQVRPQANDDCQSYTGTLWFASPCRLVPKATTKTTGNRATAGSQPCSMSLFTIQEHSSILASQPTTIQPAVDNQFPALMVQGLQKKPQGSGVTEPSKECDVFGSDSDLSLTSDSEHEEIPAQNTWTTWDGVEEIDPLARESPAAGRYPFYDDNNDLYDDEANMNMVDHPAGEDDLYTDDEHDARTLTRRGSTRIKSSPPTLMMVFSKKFYFASLIILQR